MNRVNTLGIPRRNFGIGLHCGEVIHGFLGTADRMEFTVIGDAVNRAAHYSSAAADGEILISPEMHEHVWRLVESDQANIATKNGNDLIAYRVKCLKESAKAAKVPPLSPKF